MKGRCGKPSTMQAAAEAELCVGRANQQNTRKKLEPAGELSRLLKAVGERRGVSKIKTARDRCTSM